MPSYLEKGRFLQPHRRNPELSQPNLTLVYSSQVKPTYNPLQSITHTWPIQSIQITDSFKQMLTEAWSDYAHNNRYHVDNPNLFWEAGKSFLRGKIISFALAYKKDSQKQHLKASNRLRMAQEQLTVQNNAENRKSWLEAKDLFDTWANNLELMKLSYTQLQFHNYGNKAGKLLARLTPRISLPYIIQTALSPYLPKTLIKH